MNDTQGRAGQDSSIAERVRQLMGHLGLESAHIGVSAPMDLREFITSDPESVASLSLLNASRLPLDALADMSDRLLIFSGDAGIGGEALQGARAVLAEAEIVEFPDYPAWVWTDMAADHSERIADVLGGFLDRQDATRPATRRPRDDREGSVAGITYNVTGEGPGLLLFPALLAPSQWDPLVARLAESYAVVRLGGPHLGMMAVLEDRGGDSTSIRALRGMLDDAHIGPTDRLLEVGCGGGVIARWLAREGLCATPLSAVDLNPFLLKEARALAKSEGVGDAIAFEHGNAEALPYPDDTFDGVLCVTVIEECDADVAIGEMVRVLRPGGRAMIKVRACDMNVFWNIPVDAAIKAKAEEPIRQVAAVGCADASLKRRMLDAGLESVTAYPTFFSGHAHQEYFEPISLSRLDEKEQAAWHAAKDTAIAEQTFFMMHPAHCAVGTKPR